MSGDPKTRINDFAEVLSMEPQDDGELRLETDAGVEVGWKSMYRVTEMAKGYRYEVTVYGDGRECQEATPHFPHALDLFKKALNDPIGFREQYSRKL